MFGLKADWSLEAPPRYFTLHDYEGGEPRWCPGCGDFAVLTAVQKICRDEQLPPEKTVSVSGIGCSSRFPHYMSTYGFHGLHGRAFPVACGVKARRPDLHVFATTGDGDCCSIGAGHWVHAVRYNIDMTVTLLDNNIYGLTKKQTSPTTACGQRTNTHPRGAILPPINPLATTLGVTNVSFVAQAPDWNPAVLHAILLAAYKHKGFGFVRILQRCPTYTDTIFDDLMGDPDTVMLLRDGIELDDIIAKRFKHQPEHDRFNLGAALNMALQTERVPFGILYQNPDAVHYEDYLNQGLNMSAQDKLKAFNQELQRFVIG